jgi:ABC-2 type transport system permease protein
VNFSPRRLWAIARKEMTQIARDRRMLPMIFASPVIQLGLLGYAASFDLKNVQLAVLDQDRSSLSRKLVDAVEQSGTFEIEEIASPAQAEERMIAGRTEALLTIPPGFAGDVERGRSAVVGLVLDGSDSNRALATRATLDAIVARESAPLARFALREFGLEALQLDPPITLIPKIRFNPTLESRPFMIPGVLAMVLTIMTMILTAMAIVREKENGTIEQIAVTPIRASEWILGKLIPFVGVALVDVVLVSAVAVFWFQVPLRGSFPLLLVLSSVFITGTLGLGLLISTVSSTQQQAMLTALLLILPLNMLSGIFYPTESMPAVIRAISLFSPLRWYGLVIRSIFLKGSTFADLWDETLAMAGLGVLFLSIAIARARRGFR